jgi:hypothetical protein
MLGPVATKGAMLERPLFARAKSKILHQNLGSSDQVFNGHKF